MLKMRGLALQLRGWIVVALDHADPRRICLELHGRVCTGRATGGSGLRDAVVHSRWLCGDTGTGVHLFAGPTLGWGGCRRRVGGGGVIIGRLLVGGFGRNDCKPVFARPDSQQSG